jgi:hypothetical protein
MSITDDQMFGPSSLGGETSASHGETITVDALMRVFKPREVPRGNPPFRIGDVVRQKSGPLKERNQRAVVADIKYLTDGPYKGWAIKLDSGGPPFAAEYFEPFTVTQPSYDVPHEVRVVYAAETRAYRVSIDGSMRFSIPEQILTAASPDMLTAYLHDLIGSDDRLVRQVSIAIREQLHGSPRLLDAWPPRRNREPKIPPTPAAEPEPAPTVRRRIVRRNKK